MTIEDINRNREQFETNVRSHCATELQKLGLALINVNITNIEDDSGVIEAMGQYQRLLYATPQASANDLELDTYMRHRRPVPTL